MPTHKNKSKLTRKFEIFAEKVNDIVGSPYWFVFSVLLIIIWFPSGFFLGWDELWHLMINSTTTILTFLMMSLLHSSQSKWEERMEKLQQMETSKIKTIEKNTKKLAYDQGQTFEKSPEDVKENAKEGSENEEIASIF